MNASNKFGWGWLGSAALLTVSLNAHATPSCPAGRSTSAIVSTSWLRENSERPNLVILDIRPTAAYSEGHIPKAMSAPFDKPISAWITLTDDLLLEVPSQLELAATLGSLGISSSSWVVVVTAPNAGEPAAYGLAAATRVADTLIYMGVANTSVLDGGYPRWIADAGPTTTELPIVSPTTYSGVARTSMFVSTQYVKEHLGRALVIDARDAGVYFGDTVEAFATKAGHIPTAKSLPSPWLWTPEGLYKDTSILSQMVLGVAGWSGPREIIVYCGVGGYASTTWFVLTQVLGYPNVKFYDGSAQLWVKTESMVPYRWD